MSEATPANRFSPAKLRLSDSAVLAGAVSLIYAASLIAFPDAIPHLLARIFQGGYFFRTLALLLVAANEFLFVLICKRRGQKLSLFTLGYIGFLTVTLVFVFRALVLFADEQAQISYLSLHMSGHAGIGAEELLLYTHLGIVSGIFFPYVLVRLTQGYVSGTHSEEPKVNARAASAGQ